ncbi:hypothetical protein [Paenibacillus sp. MMO-177]
MVYDLAILAKSQLAAKYAIFGIIPVYLLLLLVFKTALKVKR